jgi:hypothetical protein
MERRICVNNEKIKLLFSEESDRRLIYDMAVSDPEITVKISNNE